MSWELQRETLDCDGSTITSTSNLSGLPFGSEDVSEQLRLFVILEIIDADILIGHDHGHGHGHGKEEKPHAAAHTITHMGFSEEQVKNMFEAAGVGKDFDYVVVGKGIVFMGKDEGQEELKRSVFMARGVKL